jgi:hypothetical protein
MNIGSASFQPIVSQGDLACPWYEASILQPIVSQGGLVCPWHGALTFAMNLPSEAISQYQHFPFNSACIFNDIPLAAGHDGIYQLETGNQDGGVEIDALVKFPKTNFGSSFAKRFRYLYIGYRSSENLELDLTADDGTTQTFILPATLPGQQASTRVPVSTLAQGVYWTIAVRNVNGSAFTLTAIEGLLIITSKRYSTGY